MIYCDLPERCEAIYKFIHEDAKGPPVNSAAVTIAIDDLRRQVLFCAHKGVGTSFRLCHQQVRGRVQRALQIAQIYVRWLIASRHTRRHQL